MKTFFFFFFFFWGGGQVGGGGGGVGGHRVDLNKGFKKIKKKKLAGRVGGGVRVDVNEELKFL